MPTATNIIPWKLSKRQKNDVQIIARLTFILPCFRGKSSAFSLSPAKIITKLFLAFFPSSFHRFFLIPMESHHHRRGGAGKAIFFLSNGFLTVLGMAWWLISANFLFSASFVQKIIEIEGIKKVDKKRENHGFFWREVITFFGSFHAFLVAADSCIVFTLEKMKRFFFFSCGHAANK